MIVVSKNAELGLARRTSMTEITDVMTNLNRIDYASVAAAATDRQRPVVTTARPMSTAFRRAAESMYLDSLRR